MHCQPVAAAKLAKDRTLDFFTQNLKT